MLPDHQKDSSNSNKKCPIKTPIERIVVHLEETKTDTLEAAQKEEEQPQHKLEQDVTNVEYDIINYASPPPPPARPTSSLSSSASVTSIPRIAVTSPRPRQRSKQNSSTQSQCQAVGQRCSRLNNNSSSNHSVLVEVGATSSHSPNIGVSEESVAALTEEEHDGQTEEVERPPKILRCLDVDTSAEDQPIRSRGGGGAVHSRLRKPQATVQARSSAAATTATASVVGSNHHPNPNRHASPSPCSTLGVNMRVTGQCSQGGRKYMEDQFSVAYQESPLTHELEYAFFGIYDGHGGNEAALFAKEHLMLEIVKQKQFWSDNDEDVLRAIREGYIATHFAMWREQEKWPRTANGHLSTAGTTATVAFMRREKIYIGHVGDSGIVLGYQKKNERHWRAKQLTTDHKPESAAEKARIQRAGGNVAIKSGVPRVVWNRPRDPMHRGPIRRRTLVDDIPFLAVARSLGDLWSYNSRFKEFVVSPDPDVKVVKIDPKTFRCLIFGTDGLWNVVTPTEAVDSVRKKHLIGEILNEQDVMNPSKALVDQALKTWAAKKMRADNTSVVTVILTPATSNGSQSSNGVSEVDMDMFLEAEDQADIDEDDEMDEDERLDRENSCPVELCIEEEEYVHDTPYSALAKRHLPPEPYRNFDYYGMDEDVAEGCGEDNNNDDDDEEEEEEEPEVDDEEVANNCDGAAAIVTVAATTMEVYDGQRMQQSLAIHRKLCRRSIVPTQNPSSNTPWASVLPEERQAEKEQERAMELDAEHNISIFSDTSIDRSAIYDNASSTSSSVTSSSRVQVVRTDLDHHSFSNYVANGGTAVTTDFSFAESYNTLLNEQEQQARNRSEAAAAAAATTSATGGGNAANGGGSTGVGVDVHRMHEIIQEQQLYQQQEGYSLTQLETRSEQLQLQQHQHQQQQQEQQSNWTQPGELLELNALLQQEREEEEQVAREQMMEATSSSSRGEFGYATDWSSRNTSMQLPGKEDNDSAEEKPDQMSKERSKEHQQQKSFADPKQSHPDPPTAPTLQDNEVSSTLPATPEPTPIHASTSAAQQFQETVAEIRKEDADAVHYIFEQIQKLQQVDCTPVAAAPNVGEALERANALAGSQSVPLIRQMRRYRNVPNENHQHMQTRRRHQIFKSTKAKSFITASAAAIVAYSEREQIEAREESGADNRVNPDTVVGGGPKARAGSTSVGNNNKCNENDNVTSGGSSSASVNRRRIVNVGASVSSASTSASSSTNMVMTRRSHSLINTGVNKRQLRSSICNLGNLDLTKRTLRTRNVPAAMASTTSSSSSRSPAASSSSRTNNSFVSAVANTPTTPRPAPEPTPTTPSNTATTTPANSSPSSRRLKRTKEEEREQRRSLRRTTLSASQLSARHHHQLHLPHHQLSGSSSSSSGGSGQFGRSTRLQPCSGGAISARPPPSPKKLNGAVPTLAIGTRAYTAALAAAADHLNKRWSLRSSSSSHTSAGGGGGTNSMGSSSSTSLGGNSLMSAITCYSPRNRNSSNTTTTTSAAAATTRRR
ncbi:uncharacterized protein Dwil_GK25144 [Drosophila willistoni]|uniref:PPM-type phosphatase domain-containing protein n=1 Tax=Drosophila willistoni TaxID=7260 RepID=B4NC45_DROWI|nr:uncharacterized protein Dwil_GK25144 [Drosophila willistoni]